jgi:hypothetical protein
MAVKVESTPGTYAAPSTTEYVHRIRNIVPLVKPGIDDANSKYANASHAEDAAIATLMEGGVGFEMKVATSGAAATTPSWFTMALMCGCDIVAFGATGHALVRRKAKDDVSYSCAVYDTEVGAGSGTAVTTIYQYAGCMGNCVISGKINGVWTAKFAVSGKLIDIIDGTDIALPTGIGTTLAQPYTGDAFKIHNVAASVSDWEFDFGNAIQPIYDSADATGIKQYIIESSKPRFKCNPLAVKQATTDMLAMAQAHSSSATSYISVGTAAATKHMLKMIDGQLISPTLAAREGLVNWGATFRGLANGVPGTLLDSTTGLTQEDTWYLLHGTTA